MSTAISTQLSFDYGDLPAADSKALEKHAENVLDGSSRSGVGTGSGVEGAELGGSAMKTKQRPKVGDRTFEVEWVSQVFEDENGDYDPDRDTHCYKHFLNREMALAYAKEVLPLSKLEFVLVTEMEFVPYDEDDAAQYPHVGYWEAVSDSECIE